KAGPPRAVTHVGSAMVRARSSEERPAMTKDISVIVGLDVSDRFSQCCVADAASGEILEEIKVMTREASLRKQFAAAPKMRIVLETGTHSSWIARLLRELGHLPDELRAIFDPLLDAVADLSAKIRAYDAQIEGLCRGYPETERLRQVKGVGAVTALAFVLVIEDPHRFAKSRQVGPYVGLTSRRDASGQCDRQLGITHAGDKLLRRLLVSSAHYVLGPFGPDTDLRRWGLARCAHGGDHGKKRVIVAVARRLSVLLHRLWVGGEIYRPLRTDPEAA